MVNNFKIMPADNSSLDFMKYIIKKNILNSEYQDMFLGVIQKSYHNIKNINIYCDNEDDLSFHYLSGHEYSHRKNKTAIGRFSFEITMEPNCFQLIKNEPEEAKSTNIKIIPFNNGVIKIKMRETFYQDMINSDYKEYIYDNNQLIYIFHQLEKHSTQVDDTIDSISRKKIYINNETHEAICETQESELDSKIDTLNFKKKYFYQAGIKPILYDTSTNLQKILEKENYQNLSEEDYIASFQKMKQKCNRKDTK